MAISVNRFDGPRDIFEAVKPILEGNPGTKFLLDTPLPSEKCIALQSYFTRRGFKASRRILPGGEGTTRREFHLTVWLPGKPRSVVPREIDGEVRDDARLRHRLVRLDAARYRLRRTLEETKMMVQAAEHDVRQQERHYSALLKQLRKGV